MRRFGFFEAVCAAGMILTGAELALQGAGSSVCGTEGCRVIASFARSEALVAALGFLFWALLFAARMSERGGGAVSLLLAAALSAEGYLLGFQLFIARELCPFCLASAALVVLAGAVRAWEEDAGVLSGFAGLLAVLAFTWLANPGLPRLPGHTCTVLYSEDCPHCLEVLRECSLRGIRIGTLEVREASGLLRSLGLKEVPILVCPGEGRLEILCGTGPILARLLGLEPAGMPTPPGEGTCRIGEEECR